ncbi:hypothetical protein FHS85_002925 [Rhodoligotrophos appendicifer]|uniref:hypothetical protein n=1 Tax=Rhodoligotrophos appendicifer TaxID=987056 RepID=UPI001185D428|nr:hypothetical protein [Rhodoligotrophos appendicifer]
MIILSDALVLSSSGDAVDADNPVIGWESVVTIGNVVANTEDSNYPATNLANSSTASKWVAEDTTEQYLTVSLSPSRSLDYLAVARHNFGSGAIPVSVEGRLSTEDSWEELVEDVLLPDDGPVIFRFEPQPLLQVRLRMQAGDLPPQAAVLYLGSLLVMERSFDIESPFTPLPFGMARDIVTGRSESGNFLGRIVTGGRSESFVSFSHLTPAWYRASFHPFMQVSKSTPFFFAWAPQSYPREVGYAWISPEGNPQPLLDPVTRRFGITLPMEGILT